MDMSKKELEVIGAYSSMFPKTKKPVFAKDNETKAVNFESGHVLVVDETDYSKEAADLIANSKSPNTQRAYLGDVQYFVRWSHFSNQVTSHFPVLEETVLAFIIQHLIPGKMSRVVDELLVREGIKLFRGTHAYSTVKRRLDSISAMHKVNNIPSPCNSQKVKDLMRAMEKEYGGSKQKKAITRDSLDDFLDTCGTDIIDIRDKAVLLFGWASGGRRRSEIVTATMENLSETPEGNYTYQLTKTKTDQEGKGTTVPIKGRAAKSLLDWLQVSGVKEGSIFRSISKGGEVRGALSPVDINRIVKKRAKLAGYDESKYGAHSLRSGFVTEGGRKGKPLGDIMAMTTHKSVATVMSYYQSGAVLNNSASNLAD